MPLYAAQPQYDAVNKRLGIGGTPTNPLTTIADGTLAGTVQWLLKGQTNANKQLLFGYDTTSDFGFLQPVLQGTGYKDFILCPSGGNAGVGSDTTPDYKLYVGGTFGFAPGASVTPTTNGHVVFELTSNTTLTVKAKGSDGTVRSGTVTLA